MLKIWTEQIEALNAYVEKTRFKGWKFDGVVSKELFEGREKVVITENPSDLVTDEQFAIFERARDYSWVRVWLKSDECGTPAIANVNFTTMEVAGIVMAW